MRPLEIYRLGLRLAGSATSEAERRNVIGRLYYGLHHEACCRYFREWSNDQPLGRGSRHYQLIQRYNALPVTEAGSIPRLLSQLSQMRNLSDYELSDHVRYRNQNRTTQELMRMAINVSAVALTALDAFSPGEAADGCVCPVVR